MRHVLHVCPWLQATLPAPQEGRGNYQSPPPSRLRPLPALLDPVVIPPTVLVLILVQEVLGVPQRPLVNIQSRIIRVRKLGLAFDNLRADWGSSPRLTHSPLWPQSSACNTTYPPWHWTPPPPRPPWEGRDLQWNDFYPFEIVIVKLLCLSLLISFGLT